MQNGYAYHVQELAFFSWFFGEPSLGAGGLFSNNGSFTRNALPCPPGASENVVAVGVPLVWQIVGVRDLDGDGKADLVWRQTQTGDVAAWLMDGVTVRQGPVVSQGVPLVWQIAGLGDLDADGKVDLVWRQTQTGDVATWLMNGVTVKNAPIVNASKVR